MADETKVYRLVRDVTNPRPDRRKNKHRTTEVRALPVWKAGTRFRVRELNHVYDDSIYLAIEFWDDPYASIHRIGQNVEGFQDLIDNAEIVDESFAEFYRRIETGVVDYEVIKFLVATGVITKEYLEDITNKALNDELFPNSDE